MEENKGKLTNTVSSWTLVLVFPLQTEHGSQYSRRGRFIMTLLLLFLLALHLVSGTVKYENFLSFILSVYSHIL